MDIICSKQQFKVRFIHSQSLSIDKISNMKMERKSVPIQSSVAKKPYVAAQITIVKIDHEISLVMSSESPIPPLEFIRLIM
jgi:hypothetical protein